MVQVLHTIEVVEVQEDDLSGVSREEGADLLQTRPHLEGEYNVAWSVSLWGESLCVRSSLLHSNNNCDETTSNRNVASTFNIISS